MAPRERDYFCGNCGLWVVKFMKIVKKIKNKKITKKEGLRGFV
jgi:hypothetical protein